MNKDSKFLLLLISGLLIFTVVGAALMLVPMWVMSKGERDMLRWLDSPENQNALRLCAQELIETYREGTGKFERGILPLETTPDLLVGIPAPCSAWMVYVDPSGDGDTPDIQMSSLGGHVSWLLRVGAASSARGGDKVIAPGIFLRNTFSGSR